MLIEAAAFSLTSAINAYHGGADRIELCTAYAEGGLTPSAGAILLAKEKIPVPIHVMIRPRGGDFIYGEHDIEAMLKDIEFCKKNEIAGVVFGILNTAGNIDKQLCKLLADHAGGMSLTFHRAFDICANPLKAIDDIVACGFHRILTSGQKANAMEGLDNIASYVEHAANRIIIMPGSGINKDNAMHIAQQTKCSEMHLSGKRLVNSDGVKSNSEVSFISVENISDTAWYESDKENISEVINVLKTEF